MDKQTLEQKMGELKQAWPEKYKEIRKINRDKPKEDASGYDLGWGWMVQTSYRVKDIAYAETDTHKIVAVKYMMDSDYEFDKGYGQGAPGRKFISCIILDTAWMNKETDKTACHAADPFMVCKRTKRTYETPNENIRYANICMRTGTKNWADIGFIKEPEGILFRPYGVHMQGENVLKRPLGGFY